MTNKSKARGTETERLGVQFLRQWWPAAERRALAGVLDLGDIINVPHTTIEAKGVRDPGKLEQWKRETEREQRNNRDPLCLLIHRREYRPVRKWDAWMPLRQLGIAREGWTCMALEDAVEVLLVLIDRQTGRSSPSSPPTA